MTIKVDARIDISGAIAKKLEAGEKALAQEMELHLTRISQNTQRGKRFDGTKMNRYSKKYAANKVRAGRNATPVDLRLTGNMMQAMTSEVSRKNNGIEGVIKFRNTSSKPPSVPGIRKDKIGQRVFPFGKKTRSAPEKAGWNQRTRRFFGISRKQAQALIDRIRKAINQA